MEQQLQKSKKETTEVYNLLQSKEDSNKQVEKHYQQQLELHKAKADQGELIYKKNLVIEELNSQLAQLKQEMSKQFL